MRLFLSLLTAAGLIGFAAVALAQQQGFTPRDESPEEFPAGPGREETFYSCTACHGFKLVAQQGMNRRQWEEILALMNEKHGMPALDAKERETVLGYLETAFPPRVPAGRGWQNPFLNR
jgi:mono/diheme cytochrome c family protein